MDRFTRAVVVIVLVLVVIAIGIAILQTRAEPPIDPTTPRGVVTAYVRALRSNQADRAWDYLDSSLQQRFPRAEFVQLASHTTSDQSRVTIGEATISGNEARVPVIYHYDGGLFGGSFSNERITLLVQENGEWRISSPPEPYLPEPVR